MATPKDTASALRTFSDAVREGGLFGAVTTECRRAIAGIIADPKGREELEPMAHDVARLLQLVEAAVSEADADRSARWAFTAGMAWRDMQASWAYGPALRRAEQATANGKAGADAANASRRQATTETLDAMRLWISKGFNTMEAARKVAKPGQNPENIRQLFYYHERAKKIAG